MLAPGPRAVAPGQPRPPSRWELALPLAIALVAITLAQGLFVLDPSLSPWGSDVALVGLQLALIGLVVLGLALERRPARDAGLVLREPTVVAVGFASLVVLLWLAVQLDPGFFLGFGRTPLVSPFAFGYLLLLAPLMAFAQVLLFVGYLFRALSRVLAFPTALLISAGAFGGFSTNLPAVLSLGGAGAVDLVLRSGVESFILGMVLAVYAYKARWGILGPVTFASAYFAVATLLPWGVTYPNWEYAFATELTGLAILLVVIGLALREPRQQARQYLGEEFGPRRLRFRARTREPQALRGPLGSAAVVGVVVITLGYGLPTVLGVSQPILAIATGSMTPTLPRGELVVIHHVAPQAIKVGTIIAFHVSCLPAPTVHRVIKIVSGGPNWVFQTKGDANHAQDPCTVPYADVIGALLVAAPYAGFLILDPLFAGAVIALLAVVALVGREERG